MATDAIVVGGGIAGLAAAYELHRRGHAFVLLESGARFGGVILNEEVDGFTIDAGPDSLLIQKPDGIRLCEELGLGPRLVSTRPPRIAYIQRRGQLHALPAGSVLGIPTTAGPFLRSGLFSWRAKLRMGREWFVPPGREDADESIGAFMTRRFGQEATDYLAEPLLAGIHAGDVDRLSLRALFPRFAEAERTHGSLLRAFHHQRRHHAPASRAGEGAFKSLPGGLSELVRALVAALPSSALRLNTAVARVAQQADGSYRAETSTEPLDGRTIVLASPAYATAGLVRGLDDEIARLCAEVRYASIATVALAFGRDQIAHPLNGSGYVIPAAERTGVLAVSWLSSKWPNRAPEGAALLRTFIGGARDPEALAESDESLVGRSLAAVRPVLGIRGDPALVRVYRFERANAQHEVGHLARQAAIDRAVGRHPGLFVTGSGFRGVGIPDCIADARSTANAVATWLQTARAATGCIDTTRSSR